MAFDDAVYTINELSALIGAGVSGVKQVASGSYTFSGRQDYTVTTGVTVNPAKTIILLQSSLVGWGVRQISLTDVREVVQSVVTAKTATTFTMTANYALADNSHYMNGTVSWQLVEFY